MRLIYRLLLVLCLFLISFYAINFQLPPKKAYAYSVTYTSSGSWQAPAGVTTVTVELWGGGGAGGKGGGNKQGGGGGAGGQYAIKVVTVTPLSSYDYVIGAGGTATSGDGNPGGNSTFDTNVVVAVGGAGGQSYDNGAAKGTGSTSGGVGDTVYAGGSGADGSSGGSGGGGGGAGSTGTGNDASGQTAGAAKSEYGGAGGAGTTANNGAGGAGNVYGGAGGGATKTSPPGDGAAGLIRLTYNTYPTFSGDVTESDDPITEGNDLTFSGTASDTEGDSWYLAVCKTNAVNAGDPPTCDTDQEYCISSSAVASASQNTCAWTTSGVGDHDWYAFACDDALVDPLCSSANTTNSPVTVESAAVYSVSLSPGGTLPYGNLEVGTSASTVNLSLTQTATNDGNTTENLNIKTSAATGGTGWSLGSSPASNVFVHEFSTNAGGDWTKFVTADEYQTLATGVLQSGTEDVDLRITVPTNSDAIEKSVLVTVQAVAP